MTTVLSKSLKLSFKMSITRIILIILVPIMSEYFITFPPIINIFFMILLIIFKYGYNKFIFYCESKLKEEFNVTKKKSSFLAACEIGNTCLVSKLIKNGADILQTNENGENGLFLAAFDLIKNTEKRDASCIWTLYHAGCPINVTNNNGWSVLHLAASHGHLPLIKWLVKKGADVNLKPSASGLALNGNHKNTAAYLLALEFNLSPWNQKNKLNKN